MSLGFLHFYINLTFYELVNRCVKKAFEISRANFLRENSAKTQFNWKFRKSLSLTVSAKNDWISTKGPKTFFAPNIQLSPSGHKNPFVLLLSIRFCVSARQNNLFGGEIPVNSREDAENELRTLWSWVKTIPK